MHRREKAELLNHLSPPENEIAHMARSFFTWKFRCDDFLFLFVGEFSTRPISNISVKETKRKSDNG